MQDADRHLEARPARPLSVDAVIESRRTNLRMDPEDPLHPTVVADLCRLVTWAPNHKRTEPWRFAAFSGEGRRVLGDTIANVMAARGAAPEKVAKTRIKYLRAPVMLLIGSTVGPDDTVTAENRDAVAAGIQNLLLGATARGLASFWSSVAAPDAADLLGLCGFEEGTRVVAAVYLGNPIGSVPAPPRTGPRIHWVT